ncbi:MAG: trypsin-like peptidase domain-containing protein [Byssovorax sp.]
MSPRRSVQWRSASRPPTPFGSRTSGPSCPAACTISRSAWKTPDEDGLETQQVFDRVVDRFKEALSAANRLFRNRTQFHLLAAIPVGLAFKLGTQINPTIYPEVVTYQYWSKGAPRYNPAIVLGGKTEIDDGRPATRAGGFLDVARFDWTKAEADELRELLANAYSSVQGAGEIVARAGIDRNRIRWSQPAWNFWGEALDVAAMAGRTRALVESARADTGIAAYHARLDMLLGARPAIPEAVANKPITWKSKEVITGQQETFLEIHFLHEALRMSASVVRLMTTSHDGERALGTGFLIAKDTILTNHHVLFEGNKPKKVVTMLFNYELDASGKPRKAELREGDVATIEGHEGHDWAIIRTAQPLDPTLPIFSLRPSKPAEKGDFVFIIQHPAGRPKKIGLLHNEVVSADADTVQYLTDTLPGSSGSPVCNEHWEVVALHSGSVEGERESLWKNEGTTIARVHDGLVSRGILQAER